MAARKCRRLTALVISSLVLVVATAPAARAATSDGVIAFAYGKNGNDGSRVLYGTFDASGASAFDIVNADGTGNVQLPNPESAEVTRPDWSPDGQSIAYIANGPAGMGLYVSNSDGSDPRFVASTFDFCCGAPAWSPTGTKIACITNNGPQLAMISPDGTGERILVADHAFQPSWQPLP